MSVRVPVRGAHLSAGPIPLPDAAAHYLTVARRLEAGASLVVFDGDGHEVEAVLEAVGAGWQARPTGPVRTGRSAAPLTLVYGLAKGDKVDVVTRQVTELGADRVILLAAARSVVKLVGPRAQKRRERLERIATEAARQSGRADTPTIEGPLSLAAALEATGGHHRWILHPEAGVPVQAAAADGPVAVFIGPEGGFSPAELAAFTAAEAVRITLNCPVLRTETAAPVACALALHRMGAL